MERNRNLDVIRSAAVFFVISVHFLSHTGFYGQEIRGWSFLLASMLRAVFISCVPLFIMLTGYLQSKKEITKKYYINLLRIIISYVICGVCCQCFIALIDGDKWCLKNAILDFLKFEGTPYGWYIEMYIGLYLLIPFLNKLWISLTNRQKKILLASLILLTTVPSIFNNFDFNNNVIFYATNESVSAIFPDWWQEIYPLTYYFIGIFISENKEKIFSIKYLYVSLIIQIIAWGGGVNYLKNYGHFFPWTPDTSYQGYQCMIMSVTIFTLLLNNRKIFMERIIEKLSRVSLEIYMLSYIFDRIVYHVINEIVSSFSTKLLAYPVAVTLVFSLAATAAIPVNKIVSKTTQIAKNKFNILWVI